MTTTTKKNTRNYDIFKTIVALVLLAIIIILLLRLTSAPPVAASPTAPPPAPTTQPTATPQPAPTATAAPAFALPSISPPTFNADGNVTLSGTGEPGATIALFANSVQIGDAIVGKDGKWSFSGPLDPGDYELSASTLGADGATANETETALNFTVPEPAVDFALPAIDAPTFDADGNVTLSGTGEPGATIALFANGVQIGDAIIGKDGKWSFSGPLDPGDYELSARTLDADGATANETETALNFTVPEPAVDFADLSVESPQVGPNGNVTLTGKGEAGKTIDIVEDGVVVGQAVVGDDGTWRFTYETQEGEHALAVQYEGDEASRSDESAFAMAAEPTETPALEMITPQCRMYVIQTGDWLSKIALDQLGDIELYSLIVDATNAMAAEDDNFTVITDPHKIEVGQKLCIPEKPAN